MDISAWDARMASGNAFDAVRLVLACLVVFEHAFVLVDGSAANEPLYRLSHGQTHFGGVAVYMFFAISGLLVTRSFLETGNVAGYLIKRVARIFPGFLTATALAVLTFGLIATDDPARFFASQSWLKLTAQAVTLHQIEVFGILDGNPLTAMLSTFWTIKYEFDCYLLVALLGVAGLLKPRWALWVIAPLMAVFALGMLGLLRFPSITYGPAALAISNPVRWPDLFPFFLVGSAFYLHRRWVPKSIVLCLIAVAALAVTLRLGGFYWALLFGGSYLALYVALSFKAEIKLFGRRTDLSYGVYLYGWPLAQLLLFVSGQRLNTLGLFALGMPLTLLVAFGSWRLIEAPALRIAHRMKLATRPKTGPALVADV